MKIIYTTFAFLFGTILGSFYNVVIYRLPKRVSITQGTSYCPRCKHRIMPFELVPIISYLFLRGKCAHCQSHISLRYPMIELLTGIVFAISFLSFGMTLQFVMAAIIASLCIIIAMIDLDTMEIPDRFHIFFIIMALIQMIWISDLPILDHFFGFIIISLPLYLIALLTGGIGGGDIKLMASAGLLLGYQASIVAFFIAAIIGGAVGMSLVITKSKDSKSLIAFGPFLCIGIFLSYLFGMQLFQWYITLFI